NTDWRVRVIKLRAFLNSILDISIFVVNILLLNGGKIHVILTTSSAKIQKSPEKAEKFKVLNIY
ncbi:MAG TPA: hypothetical protein DIT04_03790, partial [Dysgonomonas sp.]|nr:hypothetical protein [Dysgonomonas sp.]